MVTEPSYQESPFNINYGFKDQQHIEVLKKQIQSGDEIPIHVYIEEGAYKIIDGGHTWHAYKELGIQPRRVIEKHFKNDADKIAFSRHRNLNRLKQSPVSYARSLVRELELRLNLDTYAVKSVLTRYHNLRAHPSRYSLNEDDNLHVQVIEELFRSEPIKATTFIHNYLPLLELPDWLANEIDLEVITASHAKLINKLPSDSAKRRVLEAVKDRVLSVRETKNLVDKFREGLRSKIQWTDEQSWAQTLWDIRDRYTKPDHKLAMTLHPCPFVKEIPLRLIHMYTQPGEVVLDPFCGVGTTALAAKELGRKAIGIDISQEYVDIAMERLDWYTTHETCNDISIRKGNATHLDLRSSCIDIVITSPPYYKRIEYEGPEENNLGRNQGYEEYLSQMRQAMSEMHRVLKPEKYCCIVVSQLKEGGRCFWIAADLYRIGEELGFILKEYKVARLMAWCYVDFVLIFRKEPN